LQSAMATISLGSHVKVLLVDVLSATIVNLLANIGQKLTCRTANGDMPIPEYVLKHSDR
jgi:hypothetical protein